MHGVTAAQIIPGVVESLKVTTREKCIQIAKFAFDYAVREGRSKVTCVHKANIMCGTVNNHEKTIM